MCLRCTSPGALLWRAPTSPRTRGGLGSGVLRCALNDTKDGRQRACNRAGIFRVRGSEISEGGAVVVDGLGHAAGEAGADVVHEVGGEDVLGFEVEAAVV